MMNHDSFDGMLISRVVPFTRVFEDVEMRTIPHEIGSKVLIAYPRALH
jgi:hypothetical protein